MNRKTLLLGAVGAVVVVAGAFWFFFLRSDAPPEANLEDAVAAITSTTVEGDPPATTAPSRDGLDGAWSVDPSASFAGYRIDEELASIGAFTAVGRTSDVVADLVFSGSTVTELTATVDMTTLESDSSLRDGAMRTRGLETNTFPEASFVLTSRIDLGSVPSEGETFAASAQGELTLHGVTRLIELELEGSLVEGTVVVVGSVEIALADYDIEKPVGFSVLSIADVGLLELQLAFVPA